MKTMVKIALILGTAATLLTGQISLAADQTQTRDRQQLHLRDGSCGEQGSGTGTQARKMLQKEVHKQGGSRTQAKARAGK
jgi:hypothetical protein